MAITKINIECTSLSTAGGEQISEKNLRKQSFKENVKFFYIFILAEPKLYLPDITGGIKRSVCLQPELLIVKLQQQGMYIPLH